LDACEDSKVVRWCRTQASSHNSQGLVVGGVDEVGMSTRQVRSTLRLSASVWWLFAELLLQHPSRSQQATSGVRRLMSASCEVTQDVGGT